MKFVAIIVENHITDFIQEKPIVFRVYIFQRYTANFQKTSLHWK